MVAPVELSPDITPGDSFKVTASAQESMVKIVSSHVVRSLQIKQFWSAIPTHKQVTLKRRTTQCTYPSIPTAGECQRSSVDSVTYLNCSGKGVGGDSFKSRLFTLLAKVAVRVWESVRELV